VHDQKEKTIRYEDLGEIKLDFELLTVIDTPTSFWSSIEHPQAPAGIAPPTNFGGPS
jgi:hypothetical protein